MDASAVLRRLVETIDDRAWDDLPGLLAPDFTSTLVHTRERFDRDGWVRLNADYPGFGRATLAQIVGDGDRAAARAHVTGMVDGIEAHFEVAMFATTRDGLVTEMVEVWADCDADPPAGTRPAL
ncbi:hypothetical protein BJF86_02200 [Serinicoccus sp. CNJ-927]|uniref:nuclear transport factor 2 family protein n=1 Tax=Serinicoccus sp. CNJ-927 TaxID=1904970 RepID=UPI00095C7EB5|nr:nuclear transport factor 2 family protein [Serinicoccus sp. CNJ-927]OLT41843.1 hypothetical protein BJF86_02200 [Serinicoccus sp. CNJ-927]